VTLAGVPAAFGALVVAGTLPAFAADPFTVLIDSIYGSTNTPPTGAKAEATFTITKSGTDAFVAILLKNTTQNPPTEATLVGLSFVTPDYLTFANPPTIGNTADKDYNYGLTNFKDLYPNQGLNGGPFNSTGWDFCIRADAPGGNCNGGSPQGGLIAGATAPSVVTFKFGGSGNRTDTAIANDFKALFSLKSGQPSYNIAGRFQDVEGCSLNGVPVACGTPKATTVSPSDKVGGAYIPPTPPPQGPGDPPPRGPGDSVPGPLPLFGAAAAFGYSRKLRQRLKARTFNN
jgi:hypothetical protein